MILYILLCLIINIFFGNLVNATFSNLKVYICIITGFICCHKYMKQVVLIKLYLPHVTKEMSIGVLLILQKLEEGRFFPKKERGW